MLNKNGSYAAPGTSRSKQESLVHTSSWQRDKTEGMQVERPAGYLRTSLRMGHKIAWARNSQSV